MRYLLFQARQGSSRFPNKLLVENKTGTPRLIDIILNRLNAFKRDYRSIGCELVFMVPSRDIQLGNAIASQGYEVFYGDEHPPKRYYDCIKSNLTDCETFVRICCDNPFLDHQYILATISRLSSTRLTYWQPAVHSVASTLSQSGIAFEHLDSKYFTQSYEASSLVQGDEHVTSNFYSSISVNKLAEAHPILRYEQHTPIPINLRLTCDYAEDLDALSELITTAGEKVMQMPNKDLYELIKSDSALTARLQVPKHLEREKIKGNFAARQE